MSEKAKESRCEPNIELDFSTFVVSLGTSALVNLGMAPDPETGASSVNLPMAKQNIDILEILHRKTKGNLTEDEKKILDTLLFDLRMAFVRKCQASHKG